LKIGNEHVLYFSAESAILKPAISLMTCDNIGKAVGVSTNRPMENIRIPQAAGAVMPGKDNQRIRPDRSKEIVKRIYRRVRNEVSLNYGISSNWNPDILAVSIKTGTICWRFLVS